MFLGLPQQGRGLEVWLSEYFSGTVPRWEGIAIGDSSPRDVPCLAEAPLPPTLSFQGQSAAVLHRGAGVTLLCVAPLSGVEFQLRQGEKELLVPRGSTSPDRVFFQVNPVALGNGGLYTCRYRLRGEQIWSPDSAPVELLLSDGKPGSHEAMGLAGPEPLRCRGGEQQQGCREGVPQKCRALAGAQSQLVCLTSVSPTENRTISSAIPRLQQEKLGQHTSLAPAGAATCPGSPLVSWV